MSFLALPVKILLPYAGTDVNGDEDSDNGNEDSDETYVYADDEVESLPDVSEDVDSGIDVGLTDEKLTKEAEE